MSVPYSLLLGALQGLTEFLPISSSGHLVIAQHYLGVREQVVFFDVLVHIGTLAAVVVFFGKEILFLLTSVVKFKSKHEKILLQRQIFLAVIIGTLPTALLGLIMDRIKGALFQGGIIPAIMLIFTGIFLWMGEKFSKKQEKRSPGVLDALFIGLMQGVAIIPGISRSGLTISSGLMSGLRRETAFQYSFFLFIPAIIGALILQTGEISSNSSGSFPAVPFLAGALTAFVTGLVALKILKKILKEKKLTIFSWYCWVLGAGVLIFEGVKLYS